MPREPSLGVDGLGTERVLLCSCCCLLVVVLRRPLLQFLRRGCCFLAVAVWKQSLTHLLACRGKANTTPQQQHKDTHSNTTSTRPQEKHKKHSP